MLVRAVFALVDGLGESVSDEVVDEVLGLVEVVQVALDGLVGEPSEVVVGPGGDGGMGGGVEPEGLGFLVSRAVVVEVVDVLGFLGIVGEVVVVGVGGVLGEVDEAVERSYW